MVVEWTSGYGSIAINRDLNELKRMVADLEKQVAELKQPCPRCHYPEVRTCTECGVLLHQEPFHDAGCSIAKEKGFQTSEIRPCIGCGRIQGCICHKE